MKKLLLSVCLAASGAAAMAMGCPAPDRECENPPLSGRMERQCDRPARFCSECGRPMMRTGRECGRPSDRDCRMGGREKDGRNCEMRRSDEKGGPRLWGHERDRHGHYGHDGRFEGRKEQFRRPPMSEEQKKEFEKNRAEMQTLIDACRADRSEANVAKLKAALKTRFVKMEEKKSEMIARTEKKLAKIDKYLAEEDDAEEIAELKARKERLTAMLGRMKQKDANQNIDALVDKVANDILDGKRMMRGREKDDRPRETPPAQQ